MKTTRYHLERVVEGASANNINYLQEEIRTVLESDNEFTRKCDYLGYSILSLDDKVKLLDEQIKELQDYKIKLKEAKTLALKIGAAVFKSNGIEKLEGAGISSITLTKESKKSKTSLVIKNEQALIKAGFTKVVLDTDAVLQSFNDGDYNDLILANATINTTITTTDAKLKINRRRSSNRKAIA